MLGDPRVEVVAFRHHRSVQLDLHILEDAGEGVPRDDQVVVFGDLALPSAQPDLVLVHHPVLEVELHQAEVDALVGRRVDLEVQTSVLVRGKGSARGDDVLGRLHHILPHFEL